MSSSSELVTLRGGLTVPVAALRLVLDLQARGLQITAAPDGDQLLVRPRSLLTDSDRNLIRRWRLHLLALLSYHAPDLEVVM